MVILHINLHITYRKLHITLHTHIYILISIPSPPSTKTGTSVGICDEIILAEMIFAYFLVTKHRGADGTRDAIAERHAIVTLPNACAPSHSFLSIHSSPWSFRVASLYANIHRIIRQRASRRPFRVNVPYPASRNRLKNTWKSSSAALRRPLYLDAGRRRH